jgi:low temperature requirement protein LtrA
MTRARGPRLYVEGGNEARRKVTWLELFFDLVFVAAVAQVAEPLRHHYSPGGILTFAVLFALIWWAWTGYAHFASRFDVDDGVQRVLTLLQMFVVSAMAANATEALDSRSSAGFAAAYATLRLVLVLQYVRARHVAAARPLTVRYITGHGAAALLWLISATVPAPERYVLWALAFAIDLGTPLMALRHSVHAPTHSAHLPERFGLFTLILLGEAVVAVMHGMKSHDNWPPEAAISAFLGVTLLFIVWWWYFHRARAADERAIRTHADTVLAHVWTYAHFPFYLGVVGLGAGVERAVTAASREPLGQGEVALLASAAALMFGALGVLAATTRRIPWRRALGGPAVSVPVLGLLAGLPVLSPLTAITVLGAASAVIAVGTRSRSSPEIRASAASFGGRARGTRGLDAIRELVQVDALSRPWE